jgi:hypothetical protein
MNILDLDKVQSIKEYVTLNVANKFHTIYTLIALVQKYGTLIKKEQGLLINQSCYQLCIKYLGHLLPILYLFDDTAKFLDMKYCLGTPYKCHLHIAFEFNDDPMIKWIETNGDIPTYIESSIKLGKGEYLMNFAHCFLAFVGFKRSRLDDDSYLVINDSTKIKLWLYLLVTKGLTWYHKFGYVPCNKSPLEYQLAIKDIQSIQLDKVIASYKNFGDLIDDPNQTLSTYAQTHSLEQTAVLFNELFQSKYQSFFWYQIYHKLFIGNVCQTNDDFQFVRIIQDQKKIE